MGFIKTILLLVGILSTYSATAQKVKFWEPVNQEKKFWVLWAYNRSHYANSDIHMKGTGYEFTLYDVKAHDDPSAFEADVYLNPTKFTIPQFNFRAGYFFKPNWSLSIGWDHMKYKMNNLQTAKIEGYIDESISERYGAVYTDTTIELTATFLKYEHTDGLNYVRIQLDRYDNLMTIGNKDELQLQWMNGVGLGAAMPWTDTYWLQQRNLNALHLAGFGFNLSSGLRLQFLKHFFFQATLMGGYINLLDVTVNNKSDDRARQQIWFQEHHFGFGAAFRLKKGGCPTCPSFD